MRFISGIVTFILKKHTMKSLLTVLLAIVLATAVAQTSRTTYYDLAKTKKKEVYQVDANGSRHGSYKNYDEDGALRNEGSFNSGSKNGVFIEYTKFPNYVGKMQIRSKETYSNDLKEGAAVYYQFDADLGVYESYRGEYKGDKEIGQWVKIQPLTKLVTVDDYNYIKNLPAFKGSMGVRQIVEYRDGQEVMPEGKVEQQYFPSGKAYRSFEIKSGKYIGDNMFYYPDGKVWAVKRFDQNSKYLSFEKFYVTGQVQLKEIIEPYSYEGYNEDGAPDRATLQARATKEKEQAKMIEKAYLDSAVTALKNDELEKGIRYYDKASYTTELLTLFSQYLNEYKSKKISQQDFRDQRLRRLEDQFNGNVPEGQWEYVYKIVDAEKLR